MTKPFSDRADIIDPEEKVLWHYLTHVDRSAAPLLDRITREIFDHLSQHQLLPKRARDLALFTEFVQGALDDLALTDEFRRHVELDKHGVNLTAAQRARKLGDDGDSILRAMDEASRDPLLYQALARSLTQKNLWAARNFSRAAQRTLTAHLKSYALNDIAELVKRVTDFGRDLKALDWRPETDGEAMDPARKEFGRKQLYSSVASRMTGEIGARISRKILDQASAKPMPASATDAEAQKILDQVFGAAKRPAGKASRRKPKAPGNG
jgi:hypothetical protein